MSEDNENGSFAPVLEAPSAAESPTAGIGSLLMGEDALAMNTAKLAFAEALIALMTKNLSFHDYMRELLLAIIRVVKCEAGTIFELDQSTNQLFFRAVSGQASDTVSRFIIPYGQGIVGYVAESRQPIVENNVAANNQHIQAISTAVGFEARNIVAVPIVVRGKIYGVVELLNRIGDTGFTQQDVELLQYICHKAAQGIEVRLMLAWALAKSDEPRAA